MNPIYRGLLQQARKMIMNPAKTKKTLERAMKKSGKMANGRKGGALMQLKDDLALFFVMMADYVRGRYKKLPLGTAVKILAALLYFVLLVDLVPDFLAVIGLVDDAAVLGWVIQSIGGDIEKYREWRASIGKDADMDIEDAELLDLDVSEA